VIVVAALLVAGGLAVGLGYREQPAPNEPLPRDGGGPSPAIATGQLPGDHPPIAVPDEVRKVIERMETLATEAPDDAEAWKQLAFVQYRAGQVEPPYLTKAEASYRHVLELDAKDLDALRGLGNVAYDRNDPGTAMEYYRRYLEVEPGDKSVRTDLATMLLASQKPEDAIRAYQNVLQEDPTFFQAQFNLAIAYRAAGQNELALAALNRAREVAPDDDARGRVDAILNTAGHAGPAAAAGEPEGTLRDAVEAVFRSHPIVGPRIDAIRWDSDQRATVTLREFPMEGMPPMVREKFVSRLTSGIGESKKRFDFKDEIAVDIVDAASGATMITVSN
jgi:Flp pilus assembly protein TadD